MTRVSRGLKRKINNGKPLDSFPYLSGDSYFFSCEFYFEEGNLVKIPQQANRPQKKLSIFVKIIRVEAFIEFLKLNRDMDFSAYSIVLHNGDDSVPLNFLDYLGARFKRVYGVNMLTATKLITPIPIGLENLNYFTNGVPADFDKIVGPGLNPPENRNILILNSFNLITNILERGPCAEVGVRLGAINLMPSSPQEYRKALAESKFVLSPPGNGPDCHRTWEALYLGAIPIVKRASWPFIHLELPVLVITDWEDLLNIDLNSLSVERNTSWSADFWDAFFYE